MSFGEPVEEGLSITFEVELLWGEDLGDGDPSPEEFDIEQAVFEVCRKKGLREPTRVTARRQ